MSVNNSNSTLEAEQTVSTVLPRSPWNSQLAYLRALFRAKKALDRIEAEAAQSDR
uniref:Uncharacterized protein n=1 Tax=Synechocystis sp. PCC 9413 TaxID=77760 RepID=A0A2P0ZGG8_9SYNC|nr:hypothetical protein [Synechocystis sp. PCC 9413]